MELRRVILFVGDVARCVEFYKRAFDLVEAPGEQPSSVWAELEAGGCRIAFHQAFGAEGPLTEATGGPMNPHKLVFYAADVPAAREELLRRGVEMDEVRAFGDLQLCDGLDVEGHRFQISSR